MRALEDTVNSRLAATLRAAESSTAAAVARVTANLSSWLSSADARTDAKIAQLPTHEEARMPALSLIRPNQTPERLFTVCPLPPIPSPSPQIDSLLRRIDDLERSRHAGGTGAGAPAVMHAVSSRLEACLQQLHGAQAWESPFRPL